MTVRTPDLTAKDLRILSDSIRLAWQRGGGVEESPAGRLTWADRAVLTAWREEGGETGRRGAEFWEDVRARWAATHDDDSGDGSRPARFPRIC